ncbi:MAG: hypothetical protein PHI27_04925 [Eubacteriales bacterium]|nr:hypothetical protein [Eubacteriales bacterium]MDD3881575.1 hypothetical protein [Eubacteriales bacterium]MDD4513355.1 hypothetical protein [Eubacteriales bacterium]
MKHRIPLYCLQPQRHAGENEICRPPSGKAFVRNGIDSDIIREGTEEEHG